MVYSPIYKLIRVNGVGVKRQRLRPDCFTTCLFTIAIKKLNRRYFVTPLIKTALQLTSHCQGDICGVPSGVTHVHALVLEVHPGQTKRCVAPRDLVREQGRPPLVERLLVLQLVLVLVVGVDLNNLPILLEPVEDCVTVWP